MRSVLFLLIHLLPALALAGESRQVQCRFLRFGGGDADPVAVTMSENGTEVVCPLSSGTLSARVACSAVGNQINFLTQADHKPMANVTIPASVREALLVFVESPKATAEAASSWRVIVIEDSASNFPNGGVFVANFYNNQIRFVIGEHKGLLNPAGTNGYAMPKERDTFNMAPVVFQFEQDGQWRTANESALRFLPGMRYLIFAYLDPVSGRPRINTYQDFAPQVVPEKAKP
jgi:hypothetical protein